eukprot:4726020-Lingulodinium_polyedra.AAC.1
MGVPLLCPNRHRGRGAYQQVRPFRHGAGGASPRAVGNGVEGHLGPPDSLIQHAKCSRGEPNSEVSAASTNDSRTERG